MRPPSVTAECRHRDNLVLAQGPEWPQLDEYVVTVSIPSPVVPRSAPAPARQYRLVDQQGEPHPVLDDLYETLEAAWTDALAWWQEQPGTVPDAMAIGVEVSTGCGDWRTLRHPGG